MAAKAIAAGDAVISFRKIFKGSVPEYVEIRIAQSGKCTYDIRQLAETSMPEEFDVSRPLRDKIFSLAAELDYFKDQDLDIHRKIANLGEKTLRYEKDGQANETKFNYTVNNAGSQLVQIFEGLTRQQDHLQTLRRTLRYDRLGVNDALMNLQEDFDNKLLPEPEVLLPVLEQIGNDSRIVEIARTRARAIAAKIRGAK
ncbi:MAG TPA: hypothetical protein VLV89_00425 [Candidatus Acidoferrum sp.]|nr:hypothetical protein [Candidatus Acidoferrum sp.]